MQGAWGHAAFRERRALQQALERLVGAQTRGRAFGFQVGARAPHCLPARFPQPYPCAEDEECGTEEYCASPSRGGGAGVQICLACRKRRKRCMRHAMCCPGNYCKNGESRSDSFSACSRPAKRTVFPRRCGDTCHPCRVLLKPLL